MADDYGDSAASAEDKPAKQTDMQRLLKILTLDNIVQKLPEPKLANLGQKVCEEFAIDEVSRTSWMETNEEALKLAMLVSEQKDYPFEGAANVKYPLLTTAALQFNARAYPAVVPPDRVVKCKTFGDDPQGEKAARGDRVSEHLSYQLTHEIPEWEEDTDRLLLILPISASVFRKTYYDPSLRRTCSRLVTADRLVVNYNARNLSETPRITEKLYLYPHEIEERIRSGRFKKFDYRTTAGTGEGDDKSEGADTPQTDDDAPQLFLEQHRLYDLDEDGYPEPYICTVHKSTQTVVRIVANFTEKTISTDDAGKVTAIRRKEYYTHYKFLQSPDGGFYGMGFGALLCALGESINTTVNLMLDSGHLANIQGGFISSALGLRDKTLTFTMGQYRVLPTTLPINQAVMPVTFPGPPQALFALLEFLVGAGKEIASIKDVLTGEGMGKNASPTTTLALIEQGLQVFTAIYKRIHRALSHELSLHAECNREHLGAEEYSKFFDQVQPAPVAPMQPGQMPQEGMPPGMAQQAPQMVPVVFDPAQDYDDSDMDIQPFSDPAAVSKMQKLAKADFVLQTARDFGGNVQEALMRAYEAADIEDPDKLIPQPDPEQQDLLKRGAEAEVAEKEGKAMKAKAEAEALANGPPEGAQPQVDPIEAEKQVAIADLEVAEKQHKVRGAQLDNMIKEADFKAKDVELGEDGTVESRTIVAVQQMGAVLMDGLSQIAQLVAQQGAQQTAAVNQLAELVAAPNELIRDPVTQRAVGSRKVMPTGETVN
jgi:chaperonin GroES